MTEERCETRDLEKSTVENVCLPGSFSVERAMTSMNFPGNLCLCRPFRQEAVDCKCTKYK